MLTSPRDRQEAVVLRAWARGIAPDPVIASRDWIAKNLVVSDGPRSGQRVDMALTPYAAGILDAIDDETVNEVWVRKSAQVGFTQIGIGWIAAMIDTAPAHDMLVLPTIVTAQDFNRRKLQPAIEATAALRKKVRRQVSRSSEGSTALTKTYPGGSLTLTGANSAADLRSKTIRRQLRDEIDEYPLNLDDQGDPMEMMDARQMAFRASGDWKKLCGSTPTIKGASRIDAGFEAGDRRFWHVACPQCGAEQVMVFGDKASRHGLKFDTSWPYRAHYVCELNGCVIEHHQKAAMLRAGRWIATAPGPGKYPSFHIDTLMSQFVTWDDIAAKFIQTKDDPQAFKGFINSWLGQSWEERGDAPDWEKLMLRREDYSGRTIPPGGLIITGGADVQMDGIYYEVTAWGVDKQSWSIDIGFLPGDTADIRNPVWRSLSDVMERRYPMAAGGDAQWPADLFGVDSGFNTNVVYEYCRRRVKARATKGYDGWSRPAIDHTPSRQQVTLSGKRRGVKLWPVGTWPLKAELYANLRKEGLKDGAEAAPSGYCHFTTALHHEVYFRQLTAEHLVSEERAGRLHHRWHDGGRPNHWLDCRIIARAMAELLGISRMTSDDWKAVIADRSPAEAPHPDMLSPGLTTAPPPAQRAHRGPRVRKMRIN